MSLHHAWSNHSDEQTVGLDTGRTIDASPDLLSFAVYVFHPALLLQTFMSVYIVGTNSLASRLATLSPGVAEAPDRRAIVITRKNVPRPR